MTLIGLIRQKLTTALSSRGAETGENEEEAEEGYQWIGTKAAQITPVQMRMARAALDWGVPELAEKAGVAAGTVRRIEHGSVVRQSTLAVIRSTFESAGVEFISENGEGIGVKMRTAAVRNNDGV